MNKIIKIILLVFLVIFLSFVLLISYAYITTEIKKRNLIEWKYCNFDADCILVPDAAPCSCGVSTSVNKIFEDDYDKYYEKASKEKNAPLCDMCPSKKYTSREPKCIENKCVSVPVFK